MLTRWLCIDRVDAAADLASGERTPRARSSSRVRFDLDKNTELSPEAPRKRDTRFSDDRAAEEPEERRHRRRKHRDRDRSGDRGEHQHHHRRRGSRDRRGSSDDLMNDKYERAPPPRSSTTEEEGDSDATEDLPERFDAKGNRKGEDPLNDLISGLASRFLGGDDEEEGRRGRRHRH